MLLDILINFPYQPNARHCLAVCFTLTARNTNTTCQDTPPPQVFFLNFPPNDPHQDVLPILSLLFVTIFFLQIHYCAP